MYDGRGRSRGLVLTKYITREAQIEHAPASLGWEEAANESELEDARDTTSALVEVEGG